jgi:predicted nuclease with TOPRIM domain
MNEFTRGLNENKKDTQILRSECATLEHQMTEDINDMLKQVFEDISNLERDFRKKQMNDTNEMNFLKQQFNQLMQDKVALTQSCVLLDSRVANIEGEVGFE